MLRVRPAIAADFEALKRLAKLAGPGFTSLQLPDDRLLDKLIVSERSFASQSSGPGAEVYLLMLEDTITGEIVGVSGIKAQVGLSGPYFNYKLLKQTQASKSVGRRFDMDLLVLVNEYSGSTEIGTLFVLPKMRGTGAGRLISQARYMLMACQPERFSQSVISELRGVVDERGGSVFWDAVGRPFFDMNFGEADEISARTDNEFIVDLMPKHPIYVDLLPKEAAQVIGKSHSAGVGAKKLLEAEGFTYQRMVDVFDGGPSMFAVRDQLRTVRDSQLLPCCAQDEITPSKRALVCNNKIDGYVAIHTPAKQWDGFLLMPSQSLEMLCVNEGDLIRVWMEK